MKKPISESFQLSIFNRYPTNYQSNLFTESRQEFTELEKKIVTLVVNQIGNMAVQGKLQPDVNMVVTIPYNELTKARYDQISEAAESLWRKRLSYKNPDKDEFIFITPFPVVRSVTAGGLKALEITMLANVVPHFAALGQRYTKYDLDVMLSLSSVYAQRMFEIVSMNFHIKKMRFTYLVDDLRNILNCPATYRYVDFRINVLEVAQRELRQKADILLEWVPSQKKGKQIVELEFHIKTTKQLAAEGVQSDQSRIELMSPNEVVIKAYEVLGNYQLKSWQKDLIVTDPSLLAILFRVHSEFLNGMRSEVKDSTRYLVSSLGIARTKKPKPVQVVNNQQLTILPVSPLSPNRSHSARTSGTPQSISDVWVNLFDTNEKSPI